MSILALSKAVVHHRIPLYMGEDGSDTDNRRNKRIMEVVKPKRKAVRSGVHRQAGVL